MGSSLLYSQGSRANGRGPPVLRAAPAADTVARAIADGTITSSTASRLDVNLGEVQAAANEEAESEEADRQAATHSETGQPHERYRGRPCPRGQL